MVINPFKENDLWSEDAFLIKIRYLLSKEHSSGDKNKAYVCINIFQKKTTQIFQKVKPGILETPLLKIALIMPRVFDSSL